MVVFGEDRYFYYSSCAKKDRSQTPCYLENRPVGCTKPHCVFKHVKPRPFSSDHPQTGTAWNRWTAAPCSAMVNVKSIKSDKSAVQVMSREEETLRQRALDSMMRAREAQVNSRVHDRLGAYVSPKKAPLKTKKRQSAPLILHKEVSDNDVELDYSPPCRRIQLSASLESDNEEETVVAPLRKRKPVPAADLDEFSDERVTSPLTLRKRRRTLITSPEKFSDKEAVPVPPRKKSIPATYFEDEPVITPPRKSPPQKRTLAPVTNSDDCRHGATAVASGKKRKITHATAIFTNRGDAEKANEPHVLSLEEILRRKKLKQQQEQHEDTATKRVATVPARRSKAEVEICVPPPRKNAGVSSVKAANVSPPRHTSVVKKRLGEPSAVGMKSFSQMMAEKRNERQLERQQQQRNTSSQMMTEKRNERQLERQQQQRKSSSQMMVEKRNERQLERQQQQRKSSSQMMAEKRNERQLERQQQQRKSSSQMMAEKRNERQLERQQQQRKSSCQMMAEKRNERQLERQQQQRNTSSQMMAEKRNERQLERQQQQQRNTSSQMMTEKRNERQLERQQQQRNTSSHMMAEKRNERQLERQQQQRKSSSQMMAEKRNERQLERQQQQRNTSSQMMAEKRNERQLERQQQQRNTSSQMMMEKRNERQLERQQQQRNTSSKMMAEKRNERQLERQQQQRNTSSQRQNKVSSQQENNSRGEEASKKPFHFQPIVFRDGEGDGLNKCVGGFSRVAQNMSSVFTSSLPSLPQSAHESSLPQPAHESSQLQPAHELLTSAAPSSLVSPSSIHQQSMSCGKATESRRASSDLSASSLLNEIQDDLLLKECDALICEDVDLDDLLMDLDRLLD